VTFECIRCSIFLSACIRINPNYLGDCIRKELLYEGVDTNPRRKSLTTEEQNILAKNLIQSKDDYITDFG